MVSGYIVAGLIGWLVGGLVNLLADDLPKRRTPRRPQCPYCDATRPALAWAGLTALLAGWRCSECSERLPWRYIAVELGLAGSFALLWHRLGPAPETPILAFYLAVFALVVVVDVEHRLILNVVMLPAILIAALEAVLTDRLPLGRALIGGGVGLGAALGMYLLGVLFAALMGRMRGQPLDEVAFGQGDVVLATFAGLVVGWPRVVAVLFIAVLAGGVGAALVILLGVVANRRYSPFAAIPYGPCIVLGAVSLLLWGGEIGAWLRGG
jgi:leader peptidase (prepilin peptidase)/N-methyltransferase